MELSFKFSFSSLDSSPSISTLMIGSLVSVINIIFLCLLPMPQLPISWDFFRHLWMLKFLKSTRYRSWIALEETFKTFWSYTWSIASLKIKIGLVTHYLIGYWSRMLWNWLDNNLIEESLIVIDMMRTLIEECHFDAKYQLADKRTLLKYAQD
jgi:hypothetical protein